MNTLIKTLAAALIAVALVLAAAAWFLGQRQAAPAAGAPPVAASERERATVPVVVTARPVAAGQALAAEDLRIEGHAAAPEGAHADTARLLGRRLAVPLGSGFPVSDALLSSGLALHVPVGERAVAVRVDDAVGAGNRVRPGDRVDVFVMLKRDGSDRNGEVAHTQTRLLLPHLTVLAYGLQSVDGPVEADGGPPQADAEAGRQANARRETPRTAVLSVPVDQVNHLMLGESLGRLSLALRHPDDDARPELPEFGTVLPLRVVAQSEPPAAVDKALAGVRLETLSGRAGGTPAQARPPARPAPVRTAAPARPRAATATAPAASGSSVEILRPGGQRETVAF